MNDGINEANQNAPAAEAGAKPDADKPDNAAGGEKPEGTLKDKGGKVAKALKAAKPAKGSKAPKSGKTAKAPKPAKGAKSGKTTKGAKTSQAGKGSKGKVGKPIEVTDGNPYRGSSSYGKLWVLLHKHREKGISRADFIKEGAKVIGKDLKHTAYDVAVVASPTKEGKAHPSANRAADQYWVERTPGGLLKMHLR